MLTLQQVAVAVMIPAVVTLALPLVMPPKKQPQEKKKLPQKKKRLPL